MATSRVSVVVISHNEGAYLRASVDSLLATLPPDGEIVVVDDASTDGSTAYLADPPARVRLIRSDHPLGAPAARNLGAAQTTGEVIVFSDAHVEVPAGWTKPLLEVVARPGVAAVGPAVSSLTNRSVKGFGRSWKDAALTWRWLPRLGSEPYPIPMISGCFLCIRSTVFRELGGFDTGLRMWGEEGAELCLRLWRMGYECHVVPNVDIAHLFRPAFPHEVTWEHIYHNRLRVGTLHFNEQRLARLIASLREHAAFPRALARLLHSDVWQRREDLNAVCRNDGEWFFKRFGIDGPDQAG